ncbi:DNA polymerase III subunit gamma/tau [Ectothiorhodospira lacustris]|uniref:DNA polymerase III subunit gamma/tau n=1 Tax=Ectothiorhodospira lacustris TaxID=2899127 RepID=UPI001EE8D40A|nr:DNA polymerase III subunit gamma/tau [Ectothiorhodospira lacustris]MCG5509380.1 DNA polymerase III subunit gamma/tau [Ectothiorhodospira lacustris]MCG5521434.1 DNA polymerase III subunit gamma/tau [Ectothiorhodospira lacustris]
MSYQVLARKWRPRSFEELVGQPHVVRALSNALREDRLHHAYLFTGTRGVGKTTIARVLAKCLNCETGVTATPCGRCGACREIDAGRFIDLIEVDAASRTKVEDTRELLDNVPYAPTRGRFKVYLIDEVHMLSTHSFNALLKTLEEPPPHVKFLLATTDPQKLPVTILSRCLQFNLKAMPAQMIADHLQQVLQSEAIEAEPAAVLQVARAASGSMRDALSLLDQAIGFGDGALRAEEVREMLGSMSRDHLLRLLQALAAADVRAVLAVVDELSSHSPDYGAVLAELITLLHHLALAQQVPEVLDNLPDEREALAELARCLTPEDLQLYYQIALIGRRDLPLVPEPRSGLEMILLRMLAFRPVEVQSDRLQTPVVKPMSPPRAEPKVSEPRSVPRRPSDILAQLEGGSAAGTPAPAAAADPVAAVPVAAVPETIPTPRQRSAPPGPVEPDMPEPPPWLDEEGSSPAAVVPPAPTEEAPVPTAPVPPHPAQADAAQHLDWGALVPSLGLGAVAGQLVSHCALEGYDGQELLLSLEPKYDHLKTAMSQQRLETAVQSRLGRPVRVRIRLGRPASDTPAAAAARARARRQQAAEQDMDEDPVAGAIKARFHAELVAGSVRPVEGD